MPPLFWMLGFEIGGETKRTPRPEALAGGPASSGKAHGGSFSRACGFRLFHGFTLALT